MDHALRSISYIADIGELVVIMARRRILPQDGEENQVIGATPKMICHVFESEEVLWEICKCWFSWHSYSLGTIHCPIYWTSFPSGLHGIFKGKWHWGSFFCQGNGLPRSFKFPRNLWWWTSDVCKERASERGNHWQLVCIVSF